jgi:uncharacterized protein YbjT (DUF2867 family)
LLSPLHSLCVSQLVSHSLWRSIARISCKKDSLSSEKSADQLKSDFNHPNNLETVVGDLLNVDDIAHAMTGVTTVFHVGPPLSVYEPHIGVLVIKAAAKAGVKHFIYSSVLHPIRSKLLNHDVKRQVEEYLLESSLDWTILRPTQFMQNSNPAEAVKSGFWPLTYNPDNEMGFIDLRDLAQVVAVVIENPPKHYRALYELCGEPRTVREDFAMRMGMIWRHCFPFAVVRRMIDWDMSPC